MLKTARMGRYCAGSIRRGNGIPAWQRKAFSGRRRARVAEGISTRLNADRRVKGGAMKIGGPPCWPVYFHALAHVA